MAKVQIPNRSSRFWLSLCLFTFGSNQFTIAAYSQDDAITLMQSARNLYLERDFESAEESLRLALDKQSPNTVGYAVGLQNLALLEYLNFHFKESADLYLKALALAEPLFGSESSQVANNLYGLSRCLRRMNRFDEVESYLNRLLLIRTKLFGAQHRLVGNTLLDIAVNCERQGKYSQAGPFYLKAINSRELQFGKASIQLIPVLESYANLLEKKQDLQSSEQVKSRIKDIQDKPGPANFVEARPQNEEDGSGWQSL
ncbi:MAG: tetratricopeptide repeat protein [Candidatus Obscuribacterales bacterium]|nr:tetratricopeptide repeat protein [Candidatus Obscuribacterales bacterium]